MQRIDAKDNRRDGGDDFRGKTTRGGFTVIRGGRAAATCEGCGSTLYPGRRESVKVRTIGGARLKVEKYRCPCGQGHEVRREAAA
jgi:hypothetical protein